MERERNGDKEGKMREGDSVFVFKKVLLHLRSKRICES